MFEDSVQYSRFRSAGSKRSRLEHLIDLQVRQNLLREVESKRGREIDPKARNDLLRRASELMAGRVIPEETYEVWHQNTEEKTSSTKQEPAKKTKKRKLDITSNKFQSLVENLEHEADLIEKKLMAEQQEEENQEESSESSESSDEGDTDVDSDTSSEDEIENIEGKKPDEVYAERKIKKWEKDADTARSWARDRFTLVKSGWEYLNTQTGRSSVVNGHISNLQKLLHVNILRQEWETAYQAFCLLIRFDSVDIRSIWPLGVEILTRRREEMVKNKVGSKLEFLKTRQFLDWLGLVFPVLPNVFLTTRTRFGPVFRAGSRYHAPAFVAASLWELLIDKRYSQLRDTLDELLLLPPYSTDGSFHYIYALGCLCENVHLADTYRKFDENNGFPQADDIGDLADDMMLLGSKETLRARILSNNAKIQEMMTTSESLKFDFPKDEINTQLENLKHYMENETSGVLGPAEPADSATKSGKQVFSYAHGEIKLATNGPHTIPEKYLHRFVYPEKKSRVSWVWRFFVKVDESTAKCLKCDAMVSRAVGSSTTLLSRHLSKHGIKKTMFTSKEFEIRPDYEDSPTPAPKRKYTKRADKTKKARKNQAAEGEEDEDRVQVSRSLSPSVSDSESENQMDVDKPSSTSNTEIVSPPTTAEEPVDITEKDPAIDPELFSSADKVDRASEALRPDIYSPTPSDPGSSGNDAQKTTNSNPEQAPKYATPMFSATQSTIPKLNSSYRKLLRSYAEEYSPAKSASPSYQTSRMQVSESQTSRAPTFQVQTFPAQPPQVQPPQVQPPQVQPPQVQPPQVQPPQVQPPQVQPPQVQPPQVQPPQGQTAQVPSLKIAALNTPLEVPKPVRPLRLQNSNKRKTPSDVPSNSMAENDPQTPVTSLENVPGPEFSSPTPSNFRAGSRDAQTPEPDVSRESAVTPRAPFSPEPDSPEQESPMNSRRWPVRRQENFSPNSSFAGSQGDMSFRFGEFANRSEEEQADNNPFSDDKDTSEDESPTELKSDPEDVNNDDSQELKSDSDADPKSDSELLESDSGQLESEAEGSKSDAEVEMKSDSDAELKSDSDVEMKGDSDEEQANSPPESPPPSDEIIPSTLRFKEEDETSWQPDNLGMDTVQFENNQTSGEAVKHEDTLQEGLAVEDDSSQQSSVTPEVYEDAQETFGNDFEEDEPKKAALYDSSDEDTQFFSYHDTPNRAKSQGEEMEFDFDFDGEDQ